MPRSVVRRRADDAERGEIHCGPRRFDQHAPARIDAGDADDAGVGGRVERRRRRAVIADGGDDDETARNQLRDERFDDAIARADQAHIDDRRASSASQPSARANAEEAPPVGAPP